MRCCSNNGETCITPKSCFKTTYGEAKEKCAAIGRRLCMADELAKKKCCASSNSDCKFDTALTWHSTVNGTIFRVENVLQSLTRLTECQFSKVTACNC